MQRHFFCFRQRHLSRCLSFLLIPLLLWVAKLLWPITHTQLLSSLEELALLSALSTYPQQTISLWKEQLLSDSTPAVMQKPILESAISDEEPPSSATVLPIQNEQEPSLPEWSPTEIPAEFQGPIIEENLSAHTKTSFPTYRAALIKNSSDLSDEEVAFIAQQEHILPLSQTEPLVLIYHTHATESFEPYDSDCYDTRNTWRSTDRKENMIAVGEALASAIEAHGVSVIHDETLHDYPSYNGSYDRSADTILSYLQEYPSLCIFLDIHRDAIQRDRTLVKPVTEIQGKKAAQLMIIVGCDNNGSLGLPHWQDNLRFGVRLQNQIETQYPELCRPLFLTYRKYNQHISNASLLFEIGSHGNTLDEAIYTAQLAGDAIGRYLAAQLNSEATTILPDSRTDVGPD